MGVMDQPVKDGVGDSRVSDLFVPVIHGELTGDNGGAVAVALLDDLQEVSSLNVGHGSHTEIVKHKDVGFGELLHEASITAIAFSQSHLVKELWRADVKGAVSFAAGLVGQGAGDKGFPRPRGSGNEDVVVTPDPLAGDQTHHDGLIDPPRGFVVDVLDCGIEFQMGVFQIPLHPVIFLPRPVAVHDKAEALLEGEAVHSGAA